MRGAPNPPSIPEWLRMAAVPPRRERLGAGEAAFRQGDPIRAIFLVETGRVRLRRNLEDGTIVALHTAFPGDAFAEPALSASRYHCDAVAETASALLAFPVEPLRAALAGKPDAAFAMAQAMAGQVRDLRMLLELRNVRPASARIMAWLRLKAAGDPVSVAKAQPWTEIAHEIGLTREALYRALAALERVGAIRREADRTVIAAPPPLAGP